VIWFEKLRIAFLPNNDDFIKDKITPITQWLQFFQIKREVSHSELIKNIPKKILYDLSVFLA